MDTYTIEDLEKLKKNFKDINLRGTLFGWTVDNNLLYNLKIFSEGTIKGYVPHLMNQDHILAQLNRRLKPGEFFNLSTNSSRAEPIEIRGSFEYRGEFPLVGRLDIKEYKTDNIYTQQPSPIR